MRNWISFNSSTNYIRAKIDYAQQNSKCRLCGDRDELVNYVISEQQKQKQTKRSERKTRRGTTEWERWSTGNCAIWLCWLIVYAVTKICLRKWDTKDSFGLWDTNESPNPDQGARPSFNHKEDKNLLSRGFYDSRWPQSKDEKIAKR